MAEEHPAVRGVVVHTVLEVVGRCREAGIEGEDPGREKGGVQTIGDDVKTGRGGHDPERVQLLRRVDDAGHDRERDSRDQ
jgi:hypothetical protein